MLEKVMPSTSFPSNLPVESSRYHHAGATFQDAKQQAVRIENEGSSRKVKESRTDLKEDCFG